MRPALIGFFLCCVVLLTGCVGHGPDNPAPTIPTPTSPAVKSVSSKKNCCGKEVCTCTACECCGACVQAEVVTNIPKVMPATKLKDCGCTYSKEKNIKGVLGGPCTCDLCECGPNEMSGPTADFQRNK